MRTTFILPPLVGLAAATPVMDTASTLDRRQLITSGRYCSPTTNLCYAEYGTQADSVFRIAIPDTATTAGGYNIAIQVVAPVSQGWAGISWGGSMTDAPITVGWQNGNDVVLSSRWASAHEMPTVYNGASYTILADTGINGTHFTLSAICDGCSSWTRASGSIRNLSPNGGVKVAYAQNREPGGVAQRGNPGSMFSYHDVQGGIDASFANAKVPVAQFEAAAAMVKM